MCQVVIPVVEWGEGEDATARERKEVFPEYPSSPKMLLVNQFSEMPIAAVQ